MRPASVHSTAARLRILRTHRGRHRVSEGDRRRQRSGAGQSAWLDPAAGARKHTYTVCWVASFGQSYWYPIALVKKIA